MKNENRSLSKIWSFKYYCTDYATLGPQTQRGENSALRACQKYLNDQLNDVRITMTFPENIQITDT